MQLMVASSLSGILAQGIKMKSPDVYVIINFCSRQWGSSLPALCNHDPLLGPHRHERKFSGAYVILMRSVGYGTLVHMVHMLQELHPIENILVLSSMSVQSGLSGGTYF